MMSSQPSAFFKAFKNLQLELGSVPRDGENPHFKSTYPTLDSTLNFIKGPLLRNGFVFYQPTRVTDSGINILDTILRHESGEEIKSSYNLTTTKSDPQSQGSMLTYFKRYSILALLGLATEDDDGNQASQNESRGQQTTQQVGSRAFSTGEPTRARTGSSVGTAASFKQEGFKGPDMRPVTEPQLKRLFKLAELSNWSPNEVKDFCKREFNIDSEYRLTRDMYEEICEFIQRTPNKPPHLMSNTEDDVPPF